MREIGENARAWKGDRASYFAKHMWLCKHYEKIDCDKCGKLLREVSRLEWANISGKYLRDRSDYLCLCPSCHRKKDRYRTVCKHGHKLNKDNLYIRKKEGWRGCKICRANALAKYREKIKNAA